MEGEHIGIGLKSNPPNYFVERLLNGDGRQQLRPCQKGPLIVSNAFLHLPWTTSMFDPKHESKPLKVHNSRDVIACSNSNLIIRISSVPPRFARVARHRVRVATTIVAIKIRPCRRRLKRTATSTMPCIYSSVSKASLRKTGVFLDSAGDFRELSAQEV